MISKPQTACLETKDLWFSYYPPNAVLKEISLTISEGDFTALIGQNGSGKTTLVKHFNGLLRPTAGQVFLYGEDIVSRPISELAHRVGYVFQNPDHQLFSPTTEQEISFGLRNMGLLEREVQEQTQKALEEFNLSAYAKTQPASLSYGLRRKISIAAIAATSPKILILDEPTTGLDWKNSMELIHFLKEYNRQGNTILMITHELRLIADFIPRCMVIRDGQLLAHGETHTVLESLEPLPEFRAAFPQINKLSRQLSSVGFKSDIYTVNEFCDEYQNLALKNAIP